MSMPGGRWLAFVLALSALLVSLAKAETRRTAIALVAGGANAELHARLRAELSALGWRVRELPPAGEPQPAQIAARAHTLAVVRVASDAEGIEVWVAPEIDVEARSEWIDVDARRPELAVLRAVESLRARFLELGLAPEATQAAEAASDTPIPARSAEPAGATSAQSAKRGRLPQGATSDSRAPSNADTDLGSPVSPAKVGAPPFPLWVGAGARLTSPIWASGAGSALFGSLRYALGEHWAFGLEGSGTLSATRVSAASGSADVRTTLLAISSEYGAGLGALRADLGAGVALAILSMRGEVASSGFAPADARVYAALPFGRVAVGLPLAARLRLRAEALAGVSLPLAAVRFDEQEVARWGRPYLAAGLGLELAPFSR